jgi:C1A family cysteine protease
MKKELEGDHPITVWIKLWDGLLQPPGTAPYVRRSSDAFMGYHALCIVGYGETAAGLRYWIAKNSHGIAKGDQGYVRMKWGDDDLELEGTVYAMRGLTT